MIGAVDRRSRIAVRRHALRRRAVYLQRRRRGRGGAMPTARREIATVGPEDASRRGKGFVGFKLQIYRVRAMNRIRGFTLIELIVTVAIAAILLTIGVPSFQTMILNNTRVAQTNEFVGVLNLARSEAIKRGSRVVICRSTNGSSCATDTTGIWEGGWIAFVDRNQNGVLNAGAPDNEEVLKMQSSIANRFTLRSGSAFTQWIAYRPNGTSEGNVVASGNILGTFSLCDKRGVDHARFVEVTNTGRTNVREKETGDACP